MPVKRVGTLNRHFYADYMIPHVAPRIDTIGTWHKLGRFVKKGEKGILILAPIVRAKIQSVEQNETDESSTAVGFRAAYVFDISQTDGQELPEIGNISGDPREHRDRLGKFVTDQGILLEYSRDISPARGTSAGGKITLLPGQTPAEEFSTLAHEVAHLCIVTSAAPALQSAAARRKPRL
jgi:hypothetical protein